MAQERIISLFCTLGPASLDATVITRLEERQVDLFRINLSHTTIESLEEVIHFVQKHSNTPICIDTEGAQARTGTLAAGLVVHQHQRLRLGGKSESTDQLSVTPTSVLRDLQPNSLITLDFHGVVLLVLAVDDRGADTIVLNGGQIGSNKAVTIEPPPSLPALSEKDEAAIRIARDCGIQHFALSFANTAKDVNALRRLTGPDTTVIAKIESKQGVLNLDRILAETDEILIDRGDLSREVSIENIPYLQKAIIRKANMANKPVHVATNLLESMVANRKPTRAEINDIVNTLLDGANGLVLAAETAIGDHPVGAADMVLSVIKQFRTSMEGCRISDLLTPVSTLLPTFHGQDSNTLFVHVGHGRRAEEIVDRLPVLDICLESAMDIEQIAHGVYSPIMGFMTEEELDCVLNDYRLPSNEIWTMPIVLQHEGQSFSPGQSLRLRDVQTGEIKAILYLEDVYRPDLKSVAQKWFGTSDKGHPGVNKFMRRGNVFLGGPIQYLPHHDGLRVPYHLTPHQTRKIFDIKGWTRIVAFHTRNVPHRGHEHILNNALVRANADGLLIHPVVGPKKSGDFLSWVILGAYERLLAQARYDAVLAAFSTYSRYCGPREALFTALCRKNFGCTHFVLGRDHTGVGNYYSSHANRELFESLGDIGITPVFFDTICYSPKEATTIESNQECSDGREISATLVRDLLVGQQPIPSWCMRPEIANWLTSQHQGERPMFVT